MVEEKNRSCIYGIDIVDYSPLKALVPATSKTPTCQNTTLDNKL